MQIIIPMSGFGERFRRAGYTVPKPLIEVEGKPIIAHVIDMFPGETDMIFICNQEHLDNASYNMAAIVKSYCPSAQIVGIPPHKLGPIHATLLAEGLIDPLQPTLVNYCDFTCVWDWQHFCKFVEKSQCTGSLPAYRDFHPHTLGTTNYAYMREEDGWALAIQEKQPYTDNRMEEYASSGSYYFSSGKVMLKAFKEVEARNIHVGNEFYASLAYIPLFERDEPITAYNLQHFMQWGTPADVAEYNGWSSAFHTLNKAPLTQSNPTGTVIVPMAGLGKRFTDEGYTQTKPLIEVSGEPMVVQACQDLPPAERYTFILRSDMPGYESICDLLKAKFDNCTLVTVPEVTNGQACSAELGLKAMQGTATGPLTFGACDFGALYDNAAFNTLATDNDVDVIVWAVRGNPNAIRRPEMFGWIDADADNNIRSISVKKPLENPETDPIVLGTFTFRTPELFQACYDRLIERDGQINGEFYLDSCINDAIALSLKCKVFVVDSYLSWGTPNDLRTYEYWQSCFHKWHSHPYSIENDQRIPENKKAEWVERCSATTPKLMGPKGRA